MKSSMRKSKSHRKKWRHGDFLSLMIVGKNSTATENEGKRHERQTRVSILNWAFLHFSPTTWKAEGEREEKFVWKWNEEAKDRNKRKKSTTEEKSFEWRKSIIEGRKCCSVKSFACDGKMLFKKRKAFLKFLKLSLHYTRQIRTAMGIGPILSDFCPTLMFLVRRQIIFTQILSNIV